MPAAKFGAHIGAIHRWIQWNVIRGDEVYWGSEKPMVLKREVSPALLESIAQEVADAVIDDPFLITTKKIQKRWGDIGFPKFKLEVDGKHSIVLEMDGKRGEYLSLESALSALFHYFLRGKVK